MNFKAVKVFNLSGSFAGYDIRSGKIYYDKRLDKYPELKQLILIHEYMHKMYKDNYLFHVAHDIIDMRLFMRRDFIDYFVLEKDLPKLPTTDLIGMLGYTLFNSIRGVLSLPFLIIGFVVNVVYTFGRKK